MAGLQPMQSPSPIMTRAQKVRERMIVETMSGISAVDKDVFLALCLHYEQVFAGSDIAKWKQWEDWTKWDDGWSDWQKMGTIE